MSRTKRSLAIVSAAAIFGIPALCVNRSRHLFSSYIARPTGFCTNSLPKQSYRKLPAGFPYTFEYAIHAKLLPCSNKDKSKRTIDYWIDLYYPAFDATIYLSYHAVAGNPLFLEKLCKNAHRLALEHQLCASHIETSVIQTQKGYQVHFIELFGQVVTPFQFYTTDGQKHFFRGALYFKTTPKGPKAEAIIAYLKQDIMHMIHTLTWTNL